MKLQLSDSFIIDTTEEPWSIEGIRIGLFGGPGSGKSWNACLFTEQWLKQGGTVVIFEPRAEYQTLKEKFDVVVIGGPYNRDMDFAPTSPSVYAKAIVNQGISMVFYTSDVENEDKLIDFISKLMRYILKYNEVVKRPILLVLEETHEYAPMSTRGHVAAPWVYSRMIKAFKEAFLQGRKLNVSAIALSPRPQEVNFTIRQLCNVTFFGKFAPQDIGYIDRECLKVYRQRGVNAEASKLLDLKTGEWLCIRGAEASYVSVTQPRMTKHGATTPKIEYVAPRAKETKKTVQSLAKTIKEALEKERLEESKLEKSKRKIRQLEKQIADRDKELERVKTALEVAGKIKIELPASPGQPIRIPKQTLPSPKMDVPFLERRRSVPNAMRELLHTKYCHERMGLTANEIMEILRSNAIPHTNKQVRNWLWAQARAGELRRRPEGRTYRYWLER